MGILSRHIPLSSQFWLPITGKPEGAKVPWRVFPLCKTLLGSTRSLKPSDNWTSWGISQTKSVFSNNWYIYNLNSHSTFITRFHFTPALNKKIRAEQASQTHLVASIVKTCQSGELILNIHFWMFNILGVSRTIYFGDTIEASFISPHCIYSDRINHQTVGNSLTYSR